MSSTWAEFVEKRCLCNPWITKKGHKQYVILLISLQIFSSKGLLICYINPFYGLLPQAGMWISFFVVMSSVTPEKSYAATSWSYSTRVSTPGRSYNFLFVFLFYYSYNLCCLGGLCEGCLYRWKPSPGTYLHLPFWPLTFPNTYTLLACTLCKCRTTKFDSGDL